VPIVNLGTHDNLILRNHGVIACGRSVAQAFVNLYNLELSCRAQIAAMQSGGALTEINSRVLETTHEGFSGLRYSGADGKLEWDAELRWLHRSGSTYRQ
jgi:ribulose-5-phosphate 4-epimerase/fuculose-1-phosphate aldolase